MKEQVFVIKNKLGLHAKPSALFVREAAKFKSSIMVVKEGTEINGKSIMGLMLLAAENGSKLTVRANGPDENEALAAIGRLIALKFQVDGNTEE